MNNFEYVRAEGLEGAAQFVAEHARAKFIGGGTNLVDLMKYKVEKPTSLVDLNRLRLHELEELPDGGVRVGALMTNSDVAYHPLISTRYPLLSRAILAGASAQLRNKATTGGNLLQRTRCVYFYDTVLPCNKREPGTGCPAKEGVNRSLAILGTSVHCIATHPSDMCVALAALGASVQVTGSKGDRCIPFAEFHRLPGDQPEIDTTLERDKIVTSLYRGRSSSLARAMRSCGNRSVRFAQRSAFLWSFCMRFILALRTACSLLAVHLSQVSGPKDIICRQQLALLRPKPRIFETRRMPARCRAGTRLSTGC